MSERRAVRLGLGALALVAGASGSPAGQRGSDGGLTYLTNVGFSDAEVAQVQAGGVAARILPQADDNAAFVLGATRIGAPPERLVEQIRSLRIFRSSGRVLQSGRFATSPSVADLGPLTFDADELRDMRKCRIGDCDFRLDPATFPLASTIDWSAPDFAARASQGAKLALVGQVKDYLEQGAAGMPVYYGGGTPERSAGEFAKILRGSPPLTRENPGFYRYLVEFPESKPANVEDFVYWSKEQMRKPVLSVVHASIQRAQRDGETGYFVALKHIYDSRYFLAYAEFLTLIPCADASNGFYLVRTVCTRIDPPRWLRGILLGRIKRAMRSTMNEDLRVTKLRLEALGKD